ncbi:MAG: hypothetical protein R3250_15200, partial [Melioribacteraceae bacterium]|nr:hypothetical protein [Melioribacteraceae bacterium]
NLNKKVYYKILAEDKRFNRSLFSNVLVIDKPDLTRPSSPILNNYEVTTDGIKLFWIPSSSDDVALHKLYRKKESVQETLWEKLHESNSTVDSTFFDSTLKKPSVYHYTVVATDSVGLESLPAKPIKVIWKGKTIKEEDIRFSGTVNRELRFINLTWRVKDFDAVEFRLYKGTEGKGLKLYKTMGGSAKGYNDVDLKINSDYLYGLQVIQNGGGTSKLKKINVKY